MKGWGIFPEFAISIFTLLLAFSLSFPFARHFSNFCTIFLSKFLFLFSILSPLFLSYIYNIKRIYQIRIYTIPTRSLVSEIIDIYFLCNVSLFSLSIFNHLPLTFIFSLIFYILYQSIPISLFFFFFHPLSLILIFFPSLSMSVNAKYPGIFVIFFPSILIFLFLSLFHLLLLSLFPFFL